MKKFFLLFNLVALCLMYASCSNNDDPAHGDGRQMAVNYDKYPSLYDNLVNTTWQLVSKTGYGTSSVGECITFTSEINPHYSDYVFLKTHASFYPDGSFGLWFIDDNGEIGWGICCYEHSGISSTQEDQIISEFGWGGEILTLNSSTLVCSNGYETFTYKRISQSNGPSGNGDNNGGEGQTGSGGNNSGYEKPDIGLEDFTPYPTALTLYYRINNQDKAKVSSATGYYGTSSASKSVSASVSGSRITIRLTGLKKGTTYYVKCKATGPGGSTTSSQTRLSTLD